MDNAVRANALRGVEILTHTEPIIKEAVAGHKLLLEAARYDLATGKIEILQEPTAANEGTNRSNKFESKGHLRNLPAIPVQMTDISGFFQDSPRDLKRYCPHN